ncbi:hypothetical protein B0H67DRAFT_639431 [Lasiosphaeris hirsuta]|uniref:Uncharacterized protein n=1 Tax=Lasiosphaeris hirsuta TaxID=260670 RepID=A0AA40BB34_9PEZI|nr:hypothetical protein B0H67DRAFT_639431 [Lasiosphaeris hirsuta]
MVRLPPAEKLSLAVRKNVRDEWSNSQSDLEKQLSELLGETWAVDINPSAIWPYHNDGYAKESLGSCIKAYVEGVIWQLKYLSGRYSNLTEEINSICHAHVLTLDVEEATPPRFSYGGCDVQDGKLRVLFAEKSLGTNISDCCSEGNLFPALNNAPGDKPLSFSARLGIKSDYEDQIKGTRHQIAELLGKADDEVTLDPNFEETHAKLVAAKSAKGSGIRDDWQGALGSYTASYFDALVSHMKYIKVGDDELVQEGFLEAVDKVKVVFRIVDTLKNSSYCEVVIDDGVLYLQCTAERWGTNINDVASGLMDIL